MRHRIAGLAGVHAFEAGRPCAACDQSDYGAGSIFVYLESLQKTVAEIRSRLCISVCDLLQDWMVYMARSKDGFTPEQAKQLFYGFRKRKQEAAEGHRGPGNKNDVEDRFEKIMAYMEETSRKLDRIEKDIEYLKEQVARILRRL